MCDLCQMQYRFDHQEKSGPMCRCGRFRVGEQTDMTEDGDARLKRGGPGGKAIYTQATTGMPIEQEEKPTCYHCYVDRAGIHERCYICSLVRVN